MKFWEKKQCLGAKIFFLKNFLKEYWIIKDNMPHYIFEMNLEKKIQAKKISWKWERKNKFGKAKLPVLTASP